MRILNLNQFNEKMKIVPLSDEEFKRISDRIFYPKTKNELRSIILEHIKKEGDNCDLNDIDVSKITDMSCLFRHMYKFNGDISKWDVSNVKNMRDMFLGAESFNGDISGWDVSNVKNMNHMFWRAKKFNNDISQWNVSKVENMKCMFNRAESFNKDISGWNVSKVECIEYMFIGCPLNDQPDKQPKFNI